jgi:aspartate carbamoyltransferase catalytic subunit
MPESVKLEAEKAGIQVFETPSLASVIAKTDVLYVTRVQQERFTDLAEYERVKNAYVVNNELLSGAKEHCIVMHPLPRNAELDPEVDVSFFPSIFPFPSLEERPELTRHLSLLLIVRSPSCLHEAK